MERDKNRPETASEWQHHISEFTNKWGVGSPEHRATNDFLNLLNLYERFGEEPDYFLAAVSGEANLTKEQREYRDLQKIALLEHTIEQNQASLPGYAGAYLQLDDSFDKLLGAAAREAATKFSGDTEQQDKYVKEIYGKALGDVSSNLFTKQSTGPK